MGSLETLEVVYMTQMDHMVRFLKGDHLGIEMVLHFGYLGVQTILNVLFDFFNSCRGPLLQLSSELLDNLLHLSLQAIVFLLIHDFDPVVVVLFLMAGQDAEFLSLSRVLFAKEGK